MTEKILILDFGSQYTQLIARRIRELNVYCEIHPFNSFPKLNSSVKGVILSGSPFSVNDKNASSLAEIPNLNGVLVGGASLSVTKFQSIVDAFQS